MIGLLISGLFIYLALRGININDLAASFKEADYLYFIPVILVIVLGHYLRCYRWGIILESLVKYDQKRLFAIGSIGFMAVSMLPARLGEFARPYLVKQKSGVRMSATMATIIVERVFDVLALMVLMFMVLVKIDLPPIIFNTGITTLSVAFAVLLVLIFLAVKKDFSLNTIDIIVSKFPTRLAKPLKHLAHSFIEGLQILPDIKKTLYVSLLSFLIWIVIGSSAYVLFFAYGFKLSLINAFAITVIVALGVMLPAAPGFVGTYHFACVLGLKSFGIAKATALSYAIALHFLQMMPVIILGLIFLPFQKISLPGMIKNEEKEMEEEGLEG